MSSEVKRTRRLRGPGDAVSLTPQGRRTLEAFAPVVAALGTAAFATDLMTALNCVVPIDDICLMRFEDRTRPPVLESASSRGGELVAKVQRAYLAGLYRHDPNLRLALTQGVSVVRLRREAAAPTRYREECYLRSGLVDRISVATQDADRLIVLNLYRREHGGAFAPDEVRAIKGIAPLLSALAVRHSGMLGVLLRSRERADRVAAFATRMHALDGWLTSRERDVLARILAGMSSEGIAIDLGIRLNTVLTYRKRAYARLGVSSQADLFSLCLGGL